MKQIITLLESGRQSLSVSLSRITLDNLVNNDDSTVCNNVENCERFEPRSRFKSRLSLIVRVNVVRNRTVVVDSD